MVHGSTTTGSVWEKSGNRMSPIHQSIPEKKYDSQFKIVFEAIAELMAPAEDSEKKIGFELKEGKARYGKNRKTEKNV